MQSEKYALIERYTGDAFKNRNNPDLTIGVWRQHFVEFADKMAALSAAEPVEVRNDESGYVEFLNQDVPYVVRDIKGAVAILMGLETRNVIGYRVYDPDSVFAPQPEPSVAVKVKPMEWTPEDNGDFISQTVVGWYHIGLPHLTWNLTTPEGSVPSFYTLEEAKAAAQADYEARIRSALFAQVQDVAGTVEAFDKDHPELYWHIAKGKITAGEPLYGAIVTDLRGTELGHGERDISAADAFNIALSVSNLPAAPAKQEG